MLKLVRVDKTTGKYLDIDTVRLIREARTLLDFIQKNVDPLADEFHIWTTVVPLCEGVINKTAALPIPYQNLPLRYEIREGLLPDAFYSLYASVSLTISGIGLEAPDIFDVNGVAYTYANFEG
jgi:hypothetical protein